MDTWFPQWAMEPMVMSVSNPICLRPFLNSHHQDFKATQLRNELAHLGARMPALPRRTAIRVRSMRRLRAIQVCINSLTGLHAVHTVQATPGAGLSQIKLPPMESTGGTKPNRTSLVPRSLQCLESLILNEAGRCTGTMNCDVQGRIEQCSNDHYKRLQTAYTLVSST